MTLERSSPLTSTPSTGGGGVLVPHNHPQGHPHTPQQGSVNQIHQTSAGMVPKGAITCAGCGKRISDKFLLKAMDMFWHEDCLKCGCCDCRLGEVGSSLYSKANLILCKRDYLRLFGTTGYCAACHKMIPAFEMVMRARTNVYHLECFACQQCNHRCVLILFGCLTPLLRKEGLFCVGDRFYLIENRILCEYDYEERKAFPGGPPVPFNTSANLAHLKRHVNSIPPPMDQQVPTAGEGGRGAHHPGAGGGLLTEPSGGGPNGHNDDASSGYGSPDSITMDSR
ncbi:unnamed protein product [Cyprideis torosa]|uniref:Uncharacterized protein n=1 Tax=Cyprideis torosa TaxID=163714 RepID=A0A7R8VZU3_9CRUS|nr:unnamed protein product [Cyprideis torosa]CAG0879025.1 unnamed protein product [Cyprideis torosa]